MVLTSETESFPQQTSKYDAERELYDLQDKQQMKLEAQATAEGNYIFKFDNDYDKIKADTNSDEKISKSEYEKYIVLKKEESITSVNVNNKQTTVHFDSSVVILVSLICVTAILVTLIRKLKSGK